MPIERSSISQHMEVVGADGRRMGTVDRVEGERIKLTKAQASDGQHHFVKLADVHEVREGKVWLHGDAPVQ